MKKFAWKSEFINLTNLSTELGFLLMYEQWLFRNSSSKVMRSSREITQKRLLVEAEEKEKAQKKSMQNQKSKKLNKTKD